MGGQGGQSLTQVSPPSLVSLTQAYPPHPARPSPTKEFWPRIFLPPWSCYHFPAWGTSTQGWSCCWWRWVCGGGTGREARGCQMAWLGGPDHVLGGAAQQKAEMGTLAEIQSCRKACQHGAPPEETRGDHMTVSASVEC